MAFSIVLARRELLRTADTIQVEQPEIYYQPGTVFFIRCFVDRPGNQLALNAAELEEALKRKYKIR